MASKVPQYVRPTTGLVGSLLDSCVPYAELLRLDKPVGINSFYMPHMIDSLWACRVMPAGALCTFQDLAYINLVLYIGTVFMRGAACSWNDNLDQEYDRQVYRCKTRPIARRAVSTFEGHLVTGFAAIIAASMLHLLPYDCMVFTTPSVFLLWLYPFGKRFTDYPQLILGFQMAFGIPIGISAMGVNAQAILRDRSIHLLYISIVAWTVVYDTVYARQDIRDDAKIGVKSMAVKFESWTITLLSAFTLLEVGCLTLAGLTTNTASLSEASDLGPIFFAISCGGTALTLMALLQRVRVNDEANCMWWFQHAYWHTGLPIALGLLLDQKIIITN